MRLLLDTHVVIAASRGRLADSYPEFAAAAKPENNDVVVSVTTIWEIAIKVQIGKLHMDAPPDRLAALLVSLGMSILPIEHRHATAALEPDPATRDPFDRMLLAQCLVDGLRLVTVDRALTRHPLAWHPGRHETC